MPKASPQVLLSTQSNYWCFTWHFSNSTVPPPECWERFKHLLQAPNVARGIIGHEDEGGDAPHVQGYIVFNNKPRFSAVQKFFMGYIKDRKTHIEKRVGSDLQAWDYCSKEGKSFCVGEPVASLTGKRSDLEEVCTIITDGGSMQDIAEKHPAQIVRHFNGLTTLRRMLQTSRSWMTKGIWLHGATGTGKTLLATLISKNYNGTYFKMSSNKWYDGYDGQEAVIIDDFRYKGNGHKSIAWILRLVDRYPLFAEVKGATLNFVARVVIFTAPVSMREMFDPLAFSADEGDVLAQLSRRFVEIECGKEHRDMAIAWANADTRIPETPALLRNLQHVEVYTPPPDALLTSTNPYAGREVIDLTQ